LSSKRRMAPPTYATLSQICASPGPWVTILSPLEGVGPDVETDRLRYRGLADDAAEQLDSLPAGAGTPPADPALARAVREVAEDPTPFAPGEGTLLVMANRDGARRWHLPTRHQPLAAVGAYPTLAPVLPVVNRAVPFYVLAFGKKGVRLVAGDGYECRAVPLPSDTPQRVEDVAGRETEPQHLQQHGLGGQPGAGPSGRTVVHGQGGGKDDEDVDLEKYLRALARSIRQAVDDDLGDPNAQVPVVLACDPGLEGMFRKVSSLGDLLIEPALHDLPDDASDEALSEQAYPLVRPRAEHRIADARQRFFDARGAGETRTADRVDDIVPEAHRARVALLLVREGAAVEGHFDPEAWRVRFEDVTEPTTDLVERAVRDTLRHGGEVFLLSPEEMPTRTDLAAVLRW